MNCFNTKKVKDRMTCGSATSLTRGISES